MSFFIIRDRRTEEGAIIKAIVEGNIHSIYCTSEAAESAKWAYPKNAPAIVTGYPKDGLKLWNWIGLQFDHLEVEAKCSDLRVPELAPFGRASA